MTCKHCQREFQPRASIRQYCSKNCKIAHARQLARERKRRQRDKNVTLITHCKNRIFSIPENSTRDGYVDTDSKNVTLTTPQKIRIFSPQKEQSETESTLQAKKPEIRPESFGGSEWLEVARRCCNYELRVTEGYCVTLHEPYYRFNRMCSDCLLGQALKDRLNLEETRHVYSRR